MYVGNIGENGLEDYQVPHRFQQRTDEDSRKNIYCSPVPDEDYERIPS
jgi:hypothetical protein